MDDQRRSGQVPAAYVVTGFEARPPARLWWVSAFAPLRDHLRNAGALLFGLWPVWAVFGLGMLLVWVTAMGDSP
jgi:hypothetical protein